MQEKIQQQSNYGFKIITNLLTSLEDNAAKGLDSNLQDSNAPYAFHSQELLKNYLSQFLLAYFFFPISRGLFWSWFYPYIAFNLTPWWPVTFNFTCFNIFH